LLVDLDLAAQPGERDAVAAARERFETEWSALPPQYRDLTDPTRYEVEVSGGLQALSGDSFAPG
jgi:hypothetical protein